MTDPAALPLVGRKEYVRFVAWPIPRLRAKVDTGAYTSALGVTEYTVADAPEGGQVVTLVLLPHRKRPAVTFAVQAELVRVALVRNSGGENA